MTKEIAKKVLSAVSLNFGGVCSLGDVLELDCVIIQDFICSEETRDLLNDSYYRVWLYGVLSKTPHKGYELTDKYFQSYIVQWKETYWFREHFSDALIVVRAVLSLEGFLDEVYNDTWTDNLPPYI